MLASKFVLSNILITIWVNYAEISGYSKEYNFINERNSNEKISKRGFNVADWLPVDFCKSGILLLKSKFCNGKVDCLDGSDETVERCRSNSCKNDRFRCNYGGCISKLLVCNGVYQCADGSDEDREVCRHTNCKIPYPTMDTVYFVSGCDECQSGLRVKEGSILKYQCINNASLKVNSIDIICRNGLWSPALPSCEVFEGITTKRNSSFSETPATELTKKPSEFSTPSTSSISTEKQSSKEKPTTSTKTETNTTTEAPEKNIEID